jgi:hypothetical protein
MFDHSRIDPAECPRLLTQIGIAGLSTERPATHSTNQAVAREIRDGRSTPLPDINPFMAFSNCCREQRWSASADAGLAASVALIDIQFRLIGVE